MFVDGLGCGAGGGDHMLKLREACSEYLMNQVEVVGDEMSEIEDGTERFGIRPFFIEKGLYVIHHVRRVVSV